MAENKHKLVKLSELKANKDVYVPWDLQDDISLDHLRWQEQNTGEYDGKPLVFKPNALATLFNILGIKEKTFMGLKPDQQNQLLAILLSQVEKKKHGFVLARDTVVEIINTESPYIPFNEALDLVAEGADESDMDVEIDNFRGKRVVNFVTLNEEKSDELKPGDIVKAGVTFEMTFDRTELKFGYHTGPFLHQLVCSNGMISTINHVTNAHRGTVEQLAGRLVQNAKRDFDVALNQLLPALKALKGHKIANPGVVLNQLASEVGAGSLTRTLLSHVGQLGVEPDAQELAIFVTSQANEFSGARRRALQHLGGHFTSRATTCCSACGHTL